jgi:putative intracellular protease/amidase
MCTFPDNGDLQGAIRAFYEAGRITGAFCHGVSALLNVKLSDGSYLVSGKTVTGFSNLEEDFGNEAAGVEIMPWRLEDNLRARGANYVQPGLFKSFAVRDGRLITDQQQYSGRRVTYLVIDMLDI